MALILKASIIAAVMLILLVYCVYFPMIISYSVYEDPALQNWLIPWNIILYPTVLPILAAAVLAWLVVHSIGTDNCFTHKNAICLKWIGRLAFIDAAYFITGNFILLFCNMNHPGIVVLSTFLCLVGGVLGVTFAALAHLTEKAAVLQDDTDLTI